MGYKFYIYLGDWWLVMEWIGEVESSAVAEIREPSLLVGLRWEDLSLNR